MVLKRQLVCATMALAALAGGCNDTPGSSALTPTGPSAPRSSPSDTSAGSGLTAEQSAALAEACRFGSGTVVDSPGPGAPPPAGSPGTTPPSSGTSPGGPAAPAAPGTTVALGGTVDSHAGSCPAITFTLNGKTVRTGAETSFGSGSCASIGNGSQVGIMGTVQGDGSIAASCVAPGV